MLKGGVMLAQHGDGIGWLRKDDRHWGLPRFVHAIEDAASSVAEDRPGAILTMGDLSAKDGGVLLPHLSHRSGRDADLLLYMTDMDGRPVASPGFIQVGTDGLAWDTAKKRFLRWDIERQWLLTKHLVTNDQARIQWIFVHRTLNARLIEWARARSEPAEVIVRAIETMLEPRPGGAHDDHFHIRTACAPEDQLTGCEPSGPARPWFEVAPDPELGDLAQAETEAP